MITAKGIISKRQNFTLNIYKKKKKESLLGAHVRRKRGSSVPLATDVLSDLPECRNVKKKKSENECSSAIFFNGFSFNISSWNVKYFQICCHS